MNNLSKIAISLVSLFLLASCGGGSSSSTSPLTVAPGGNTKVSYAGQPANLSGSFHGVTKWATATGIQDVDIVLLIKQNASAVIDISIFPNKGGASGSIFSFGGGFRTSVIVGNQLFEKFSGEEASATPYGEIGDIGFYINKIGFAEIEVTKTSDNSIHLRMKAAQLSPTVSGKYVETFVEGDLVSF